MFLAFFISCFTINICKFIVQINVIVAARYMKKGFLVMGKYVKDV